MQQRRSHKKSRRGCLNCKKWHTKCDESGPPCNNCTLRNAKCEYAWAKNDKAAAAAALAHSRRSLSSRSFSTERNVGDPASLVTKECRRMMELDLMHCWSTTTYKSLCSVPEDHYYMQCVMPREALQYDFLLNGIFVAAALHRSTMTSETEAKGYFNVAMELYDRASRSFRTHLEKMDPATYHMLYIYSSMTAFINIAFSQCNFVEGSERNTLSTVAVAFDLLNGSVNIAQTDFQRLLDSPIPIRAYLNYGLASAMALNPDTQEALSRLESLNDLYHIPRQNQGLTPMTMSPPSNEELSGIPSPNPPQYSDSISTTSNSTGWSSSSFSSSSWGPAIALLQRCFAEEQRAILRGFCFIFPGGAGPDFAAAVKRSDPMALLILMHWTVLIERAGAEYWWAKGLGRRLAMGCWQALRLSSSSSTPSSSSSSSTNLSSSFTPPALLMPEWAESLAWVRDQLGLPEYAWA